MSYIVILTSFQTFSSINYGLEFSRKITTSFAYFKLLSSLYSYSKSYKLIMDFIICVF